MVARDTIAIKSVGTYFKNESNELEELKQNITKQIREFEDQFKGVDASHIINKLESIINELNLYIENLNYYGDFMISLANHDIDIIAKTKKNILNVGVLK